MQIFVRLPNGGQIAVDVEANTTIDDLRLFNFMPVGPPLGLVSFKGSMNTIKRIIQVNMYSV
jgi:hypothetical protein